MCEDSWVMGPLLEEGCYGDVGVRGQLGHGTTARRRMLRRCRCARTVGSWDHCLKKDVT